MLQSFNIYGSVITLGALAGVIYLLRRLIYGKSAKTDEKS